MYELIKCGRALRCQWQGGRHMTNSDYEFPDINTSQPGHSTSGRDGGIRPVCNECRWAARTVEPGRLKTNASAQAWQAETNVRFLHTMGRSGSSEVVHRGQLAQALGCLRVGSDLRRAQEVGRASDCGGLKTNKVSRTYKCSISLVSPDVSRIYPGQKIPGQVCHEYLGKQAQKYNIADKNQYTTPGGSGGAH